MSRKEENTSFVCAHCGADVLPATNGGYRNHCPFCLYSRHVDLIPGDRKNPCGGLMRPVGAVYHSKKGWQVIHQCETCGAQSRCKIAEGPVQPDDIGLLAKIIRRMP